MDQDKIIALIKRWFSRLRNTPIHIPKEVKSHRRFFEGRGCELQNTVFNTTSGTITLGDYTFFGHNCCVITGTHDYTKRGLARQNSYPLEGRDINIGRGVWIGSNATILGPCSIGDDCVVGAGAVVLPGEYPAGSLLLGVPARVKKTIDFGNLNT